MTVGVGPAAAFVLAVALVLALKSAWTPEPSIRLLAGILVTASQYAIVAGAAARFGRGAAVACGGWGAAFGLGWPRWSDAWRAPLFLVASYLAQGMLVIALEAAVPPLRGHRRSNIDLHNADTVKLAIDALLIIVLAPLSEELVYRGMLLRTLMQRWGFWPSAVVSSVLFGAGHAWQEHSVASAVLLVLPFMVFGVLQCVLVRLTGRLAPGMLVHAASNSIAFGLSAGILTGALGRW